MADLFELAVFLNCDPEVAAGRLAARHLAAGLVAAPAEARHRAETNDLRNARLILEDGCRERAELAISTG